MLNSFRIVFVTVGSNDGGGPGTIPRCDYVQSGGENFIFTDWGFNPDNIDDAENSAWNQNFAYDPRTLQNMIDAYGLSEGGVNGSGGELTTVLGGRDAETLVGAAAMSDPETTSPDELFTRGGDNDLLIPSANFPDNGPIIEGSTASNAITATDDAGTLFDGTNKALVNAVDIPIENDWPQYIYIGAVGAGGAGRGCLSSVEPGGFGGQFPCPQSTSEGTNQSICLEPIFNDPEYKAGGTGAEGSFFLRICGANPDLDGDGNEERRVITIVTKVGKGGIKSWDSHLVRSANERDVVEFPDQTTGEKDTTVTVYDGLINIESPDESRQIVRLTCPGGSDSIGNVQTFSNQVQCNTTGGDGGWCSFCDDALPPGQDVLDISCCDPDRFGATAGREQVSTNESFTGSFIELNDNYFKSNANGSWIVTQVSTDQSTDSVGGEFGTAITPSLTEFGIANHGDWYSNMRGWNDPDVDTSKFYEPGLAGSGKFRHWRPIPNNGTHHQGENVDGCGGNGGSVYIGYGANIFSKAAIGDGDPHGGGGSNVTNNLTAGSGFSGFIKPKADRTFEYVSTEEEALNYEPIGDVDAKGRKVSPIVRFTEIPEITREGDFYVTVQAYHMEDIDKLTFIMDGGTPVDVFEPVNHPNDLGTDYDKSASTLGAGYKEFMVRVDTSTLSHNTVHEIRLIAWPKHGYPVVLQEQKPLANSNLPDSQWKINPIKYPWIDNVYPDSVVDLSEHEVLDVEPPGVVAGEQIINPITGDNTWHQTSTNAVLCGYNCFEFRYQDPTLRKRLYINPANTNESRSGSRENPYRTLSDALHSIETLSSADQKDYLSASFYLMGPEVDAGSSVGLTGGVHDWFTDPHSDLGQIDDLTGGGRQVITVEADPEYVATIPEYFNYNQQFPVGPDHDQVMLLPFNGGGPTQLWAPDADIENGIAFNSAPALRVHYKNLRIPLGLPNFASNYNFESTSRNSTLGDSIFLESLHCEPWHYLGRNYNYVGYTGVRRGNAASPTGLMLQYADLRDPCQNGDCDGCPDACEEVPYTETDGFCIPDTNCIPARDRSRVLSDPEGTTTKVDWQLADPRLPYYDMFVGEGAFYPELGWTEPSSGTDLNRKLVKPSTAGNYAVGCACRGMIGRRFQAVVMVKHHFEEMCSGDTSANYSGAMINVRADLRDSNFEGYRSIVSGTNVVHSDMQQVDRSTLFWCDNRMMVDILLTNNAAQLFHLSGNSDTLGPPWSSAYSKCCICAGNPDPCQRTNQQKQACNACDDGDEAACAECVRSCSVHASKDVCEDTLNGTHVATSSGGSWMRTHKIRNLALVRFKSDGWVASNNGNMVRSWDHLYIKGNRLRKSTFGMTPSRQTQGFTWNGELMDPRNSHVYFADNQEDKLLMGGLHKDNEFADSEDEQRALSYSLGYYRTSGVNQNGSSKFPAVAPGDNEAPIELSRSRQYLPIVDPVTGLSVVDGTENAVTDSPPGSDQYLAMWRNIGQFSDPRTSIYHWDTCIFSEPEQPQSFITRISNVDVILNMRPNPYDLSGTQVIPPADIAFSQSVGCSNNICGPALGIPGGLISDGTTPTTVTYTSPASALGGELSETYNVKFLPSKVQSVDDITGLYDGITAPVNTSVSDLERSGKFGTMGWSNVGEPVLFIAPYAYRDLWNAHDNGGLEYTEHMQFATNYTPHKL